MLYFAPNIVLGNNSCNLGSIDFFSTKSRVVTKGKTSLFRIAMEDQTMKFTGKETPRELRRALMDCSDVMTKMIMELTKDPGVIELFLLVRTFQIDILAEMAKKDQNDGEPIPNHGERADLLN